MFIFSSHIKFLKDKQKIKPNKQTERLQGSLHGREEYPREYPTTYTSMGYKKNAPKSQELKYNDKVTYLQLNTYTICMLQVATMVAERLANVTYDV